MTLKDFFAKYVFTNGYGNVPVMDFELLQFYYLATQKELKNYHKDKKVMNELLENSKLPKMEQYIKGEKVTKYLINDEALAEIISLIMGRFF